MFATHNVCSGMKFVDRKEEIARLEKALHGVEPAGLVVVYGRRRLGKSTLIKRVLRKGDLYFMADNSLATQQRRLLAELISTKYKNFASAEYVGWEALFLHLNDLATEHFTLCLDEFPMLVRSDSSLPSVLQKLLDTKQLRYTILLCGSAQQMMQGLVLDATEPLYGRADALVRLTPIKIAYLQEVLGTDAVVTIEEYSVWGGVPRYWELRERANSLMEAVKDTLLTTNGTLYDEPTRLFMDDLQQTSLSSTLLSLIGNGAHRLVEIAARMGKPATELNRPLAKLTSLGFVEVERPFGETVRSSKRSLYKIADPFMAFFYRFILPNRSLIALERTDVVAEMIGRQMSQYVAVEWERLCRRAVSGNVVCGTRWGTASRWWGTIDRGRMVEFDLVAESLDGGKVLVGECKWTEGEETVGLLAGLRERSKGCPFVKGREVVPVVFLKRPARDGVVSNVFLPDHVVADNFE